MNDDKSKSIEERELELEEREFELKLRELEMEARERIQKKGINWQGVLLGGVLGLGIGSIFFGGEDDYD